MRRSKKPPKKFKFLKTLLLLLFILLGIQALEFSILSLVCRPLPFSDKNLSVDIISSEVQNSAKDIPGYFRGEEQTYLTFPEWYIVYATEDYSKHLKKGTPSKFPYFKAVGQYWSSYCKIYSVTRETYPFNSGYHFMLMVIGNSFSMENILKGVYENSLGKVSEILSSNNFTEEDIYAQKVLEDYATFMHTEPWYRFNFIQKMHGLWKETPLWGKHPLRKWERKVILSGEYGTKALYGFILKSLLGASYSTEESYTYAVVTNFDSNLLSMLPEIRLIKNFTGNLYLISLPRYEPVTRLIPILINKDVQFLKIAGNDTILVSGITKKDWGLENEKLTAIFEMQLLDNSELKRVGVIVPVDYLHAGLTQLHVEGFILEHIYDY